MNSHSAPFRRLQLLQDAGPLELEILQEQATALGRLGRALEQTLAALREFDRACHPESPRSIPGPLAAERAALRDRAGTALWQFVIQREACGLRDARQIMRDYRVPAEVQARMGAMPAGQTPNTRP
ncbi:MAG: hypothetical protein JWN71_276 [Xanthobacteraceae bacterium]|jgi:hypothetical protein|nr:hypothetical protein [Xanthobacteraceae bacterium]